MENSKTLKLGYRYQNRELHNTTIYYIVYPMRNYILFFIPITATLILSGCVNTTQSPSSVNVTNTNTAIPELSADNLGLMIACPEGMKAFSDDILYFCYPDTLEVDVDNEHYFIFDPAQDETLIRELALKKYSTKTLQEHLTATYVNSDAANKGVTCDFLTSDVANGTLHTIIGYPDGDPSGQDLSSVEVCRDTEEYADALEELPAEDFFEPTQSNGYYLIINGEQDVLFGKYNADFLDSISLSSETLK